MNLNYNAILVSTSLLLSLPAITYGQKVTVKSHSIEGYGEHEEFARKAAKLLEDVFNSDEFETRVKGEKFERTNRLTNG